MSSLIRKGSISLFNFNKPRCYDSWCGSDDKVRIQIENESYLCRNGGQRIKIEGFNGFIRCPNPDLVCRNIPAKKEVVSIFSSIPDRGPNDGGNLIGFSGVEFRKFNVSSWNINVGGFACHPKAIRDNHILCRLDKIPEDKRVELTKAPVSVFVEAFKMEGQYWVNNTLDSYYHFMEFSYELGNCFFSPSFILISILIFCVHLFF